MCFHCDNESAVGVINKGLLPIVALMQLRRCLAFFAAYFRFSFMAEHVAGALNRPADALSRGDLHSFLSLVPQAGTRTSVPEQLLALLVTNRPDWGSLDWTRQFRSCLIMVSQPPLQPHTGQVGGASLASVLSTGSSYSHSLN